MNTPRYFMIDLFSEDVRQAVAAERDALQAASGVGAIAVDRFGRRVYDGEYDVWFSLGEYINHFPAVAWIRGLCPIQNWFDYALLQAAPAGALIPCRPESGAQASLVFRQPDGGVVDPRLTVGEDFFPVEMATEEGLSGFLQGGDWAVIPYVRQQAPDYDACCRSYVLQDVGEREQALARARRHGRGHAATRTYR